MLKKRLEAIIKIMENEASIIGVEKELEVELKLKWKKLRESII